MTNEQMDELRAEIGRASPMTCEEERLLLKAVKEKGADSDEMKAIRASQFALRGESGRAIPASSTFA